MSNKQTAILMQRRPELQSCAAQIETAYWTLLQTVTAGGTIFTCGNGGSHSDSIHIVGELLKSFKKKRPLPTALADKIKALYPDELQKLSQFEGGIKALALGTQAAFNTAFSNDVDADLVFGQELLTLGTAKDVLICISTSGNSLNVKYAAMVARAIGMSVILLTGQNHGVVAQYADTCICVPELETYKVQELHIAVYHCLCLALEEALF